MNYKAIKLVFIFLFIILQQFACGCVLTSKLRVHVHNNLPANNNLLVHCYSKDDDLGYHTLGVGQQFQWPFCANFLPTTLYSCTLTWVSKTASFEAFKEKIWGTSGENYHWIAKSDGIYFSGDAYPADQQKKYDWTN